MSEHKNHHKDCEHENLEFGGTDQTEPGVFYEDWYCGDCGATVVKVYEPSHRLIMPIDGDAYPEALEG